MRKPFFKRFFSGLCAAALCFTLLPAEYKYAEAETAEPNEELSESGNEKAKEIETETAADITQIYGAGEVQGDVTREEWIHQLVTIFDMSVEDASSMNTYFSDLVGSEYADEIELAANFGVFDVEGEAFLPDDFVTREFAAHTLNFCMGYSYDGAYSFSDSADCTYLNDIQISLERGWFTLIGTEFCPDLFMTEAEYTVAIADAKEAVQSTAISENYNSKIECTDSVIALEDSVSATLSGDVITVSGSSISISAGDVFSVPIEDMTIVRKAVKVDTDAAGTMTITTEEATDAVESIDAQGYAYVDYSNIEVLSDELNVTLEEPGRSAQPIAAGEESIPIVGASGTYSVPDIKLSGELPISDGLKVKLGGKITNIKVPYTMSASKFYLGVDATANMTATLIGSISKKSAKSINLLSVPIVGSGDFGASLTVSVSVSVEGQISLISSFDFGGGVQYDKNNGWRVVHNFHKKSFSVEISASEKVAIKGALTAKVMGKSIGEVYIMAGEKGNYAEKTQADGVICGAFKAHAFAELGANISLFGKKFSKSYAFINAENSPFVFSKHFENGAAVSKCSYGNDNLADFSSGNEWNSAWGGYSAYGMSFRDLIPVTTISEDTVLTKDMTIEGELILEADLDLNGYTLTVNGDLTQNKGELYIHGGRLNVNGIYTINNGSLRMEDKSDYVYTDEFRNSRGNNLTAGTLEVKGDFICYNGDMKASGTHEIILSGESDQYININSGIIISTLTIKNSDTRNIKISGVIYTRSEFNCDKKLSFIGIDNGTGCGIGPKALDCEELNATGDDFTLASGDDWNKFENIEFNGKSINIDGNLYLRGGIDLNGAEMTVTGNVTHESPARTYYYFLYVHGGTVKISGDYISSGYSGNLKMQDASDYVYIGGNIKNDNMGGAFGTHILEAGTLEIAGDAYIKSDNFNCSSSHKVVLSGEGDQNIYFVESGSHFNNLIVKNSDTRSLILDGKLNVNGSTSCDGKSLNIISNNGSASFGSLKCDELNVSGDITLHGTSTLSGDIANIDGNLTLNSSLTIDNCEVTVNGELLQNKGELFVSKGSMITDSYEQSGGTLYIKRGNLTVNKDCELEGSMQMDNQSGSFVVNGDFTSKFSSGISIDAGTLEFKGDVTCYGDQIYLTSGTSQTILSGTEDQTLFLEYYNINEEKYHFNQLKVLNSDFRNIIIPECFDANNVSCDGDKINLVMDNGCICGLLLKCDVDVEGDLYTNKNTIDLNGHTLKIDGDVYQRSGTIKLNGGKMYCNNYTISSKNGDAAEDAVLNMTNKKDYLCINGDFTTNTTQDHSDYLTAGTMELKGDFYQMADGTSYAFPASGTHRVLLSGDDVQNITFDSYDDSHFNILELSQPKDQYIFNEDPCWMDLIDEGNTTTTTGSTTTESDETTTNTLLPTEILYGDINLDSKVDLTDAILLNKVCAGAVEIFDQAAQNADCDADGDTTTNDAIVLLRFLVHLVNELPSAE